MELFDKNLLKALVRPFPKLCKTIVKLNRHRGKND